MKRMAALVLTLVLLLTSLAIPAMADGQDLSAVITWYQSVKNGSAKKLAGDPVYVPKLVVAVFDEGEEPTECSLNYSGGDDDGFHGIPYLISTLTGTLEETMVALYLGHLILGIELHELCVLIRC